MTKGSAILLFIFLSLEVMAGTDPNREEVKRPAFWTDAGMGWGGMGGAYNIGFAQQHLPKTFAGFRYNMVLADRSDNFFVHNTQPRTDAFSAEINYGLLHKFRRRGIANISAGISYVQVVTQDHFYTPKEKQHTAGLVIRAQLFPRARWFGFGISPFVNLNPVYTHAGLTVNFAAGRINRK